jgi:hypothetical protein
VRVPLLAVIPLCLVTVTGVWWFGTRSMDFLEPPDAAKLESIRAEVQASLQKSKVTHISANTTNHKPHDPIPPPEVLEPKPPIDLGDLKTDPVLDEYSDLVGKGADHLIDTAVLLETEGEFQRALLAWERVLDSGKPGPTQIAAAVQAIKRLRPTLPEWNSDPGKRIAVVLHAGTGRRTSTALKPALEAVARDIEKASSGILQVSSKITVGKESRRTTHPTPVALWLAGAADKSRSTEVLSFTVSANDQLTDDLARTAFQVICGFAGRGIQRNPPPGLFEGESVTEALGSHITRMLWRDLGLRLNHPPEKSE